jgi:Uma2 family endonuclease
MNPTTRLTLPPNGPVPDDDSLYEVVNGERREKPVGAYESGLASFLQTLLDGHARSHALGRFVIELLFQFEPDQPQWRPDLAFVSFTRWPRDRRLPSAAAWQVVPELAVEVNSPSNTLEQVAEKIEAYFRGGVQVVWLILPSVEQVHVCEPGKDIRVLRRGDILTGEPLLSGLRLSLDAIFTEGEEGAALSSEG